MFYSKIYNPHFYLDMQQKCHSQYLSNQISDSPNSNYSNHLFKSPNSIQDSPQLNKKRVEMTINGAQSSYLIPQKCLKINDANNKYTNSPESMYKHMVVGKNFRHSPNPINNINKTHSPMFVKESSPNSFSTFNSCEISHKSYSPINVISNSSFKTRNQQISENQIEYLPNHIHHKSEVESKNKKSYVSYDFPNAKKNNNK